MKKTILPNKFMCLALLLALFAFLPVCASAENIALASDEILLAADTSLQDEALLPAEIALSVSADPRHDTRYTVDPADRWFTSGFAARGGKAPFKTPYNRRYLPAVGQKAYDVLRIALPLIAGGEADCGIIEFTPQALGTVEHVAVEDFGVSSEQIDLTDKSATVNRLNECIGKACRALISDDPSLFYWYEGTSYYLVGSTTYILKDNKDGTYSVRMAGSVKLLMVTDTAYRDTGRTESHGIFVYTDPRKIESAKTAIENALAIVEEAKDMSDLAKLTHYMRSIRELCDYDDTASASADSQQPWRLINVFDGDPDTKVVCEGYSKAFQFLCDKTKFETSGIFCYTVRGEMYDQNYSGGGHMWNIVRLPQGNYLADITNCLTMGTYRDTLFLATPRGGDTRLGYTFRRGGFTYNGRYYMPDLLTYHYRDNLYTLTDLTLAQDEHTVVCAAAPELRVGESFRILLGGHACIPEAERLLAKAEDVTVTSSDPCVSVDANGILRAEAVGSATVRWHDPTQANGDVLLHVTVSESLDTFTLPESLTSVRNGAFDGTHTQRVILSGGTLPAFSDTAFDAETPVTVVLPRGMEEEALYDLPEADNLLWIADAQEAAVLIDMERACLIAE